MKVGVWVVFICCLDCYSIWFHQSFEQLKDCYKPYKPVCTTCGGTRFRQVAGKPISRKTWYKPWTWFRKHRIQLKEPLK